MNMLFYVLIGGAILIAVVALYLYKKELPYIGVEDEDDETDYFNEP